MFGKLLPTTVLAGIALIGASFPAASETVRPQQAQHTQTSRLNRPVTKTATTDRRQLIDEAVSALRDTQNALVSIDRNKTDEAIAELERATGKLEIVLARTPSLALAPIDVSAVTYDVLGTVQSVDRVRAEAKAAMDRGHLPEARRLIEDLASETVVSIRSLPLATYPNAIKQAAALLHQGKAQQAKTVLETALTTVVDERVIIPLPLVRAQAAVEQARNLAAKADRSPADNAALRAHLAEARVQRRLGQALGYATEKDMTALLDAVDEIERKTSGQQHGAGLLDRISRLFETARNASQPQGARR